MERELITVSESEGYSIKETEENQFTVYNRQGKASKQVDDQGNLVDNSFAFYCDDDGCKVEPFNNGVATFTYKTPTRGEIETFGGDLLKAYMTRSGYVFGDDALATAAKSVFEDPTILLRFTLGDEAYKIKRTKTDYGAYGPDKIYKILLDVAQHSYEESARTKGSSKDLSKLEKSARKVVSHMVKEYANFQDKSKHRSAIEDRIAMLVDSSAQKPERGE